MINSYNQEQLNGKSKRYTPPIIGGMSLVLGLSLGACFLGRPFLLSALASEPGLETDRTATLETAATLATRIKQTMPQDSAESSPSTPGSTPGTSESAFNFPQNFIPPGDGRPDNTRGSGARPVGVCATDAGIELEAGAKGIYPLMPSERYGLTFQSHPTVFIDFDGNFAPMVVLRVESEAGDYSELVRLPVAPGQSIQGFALPSDRPPLDVGKNYLWTLMVACDGEIKPYHPLFTGWVQRVAQAPDVAEQLGSQPIVEQISWYADQGYWYDLVTALQQEITTAEPDNAVVMLWNQLLTFVDETNG